MGLRLSTNVGESRTDVTGNISLLSRLKMDIGRNSDFGGSVLKVGRIIEDSMSAVKEGTVMASRDAKDHERWNGEFYVNYSDDRPWNDAVQYEFISGGGKPWFSRTLKLLHPGDRIWVKVSPRGFVGVGLVTEHAQPVKDFHVKTREGNVKLLDIGKGAHYDQQRQKVNDLDNCEWYVRVRWLETVPKERAINEKGMYGNRGNTVCRPKEPRWCSTVERLKQLFPEFDKR
jgi:hypothetical protein